jgi:hypothetical protein
MDLTLRVIRIALEVLSERVFSILAMSMTFALSCWAMYEPTWERMAVAGAFGVAVFIPSLRVERKSHGAKTENA